MPKTTTAPKTGRPLPLVRCHKGDSRPNVAFSLTPASLLALRQDLGLSKAAVAAVAKRLREGPLAGIADLLSVRALPRVAFERLRRRAIASSSSQFAIRNVEPAGRRLWSGKPIRLHIDLLNPAKRALSLLSVTVFWRGQPFVVERALKPRDYARGFILLRLNNKQTLPPGPARFVVTIYDSEGGQSAFRTTCVVLPSNPLSLSLGPRTYYVTGSYSARGHYDSSSDSYITDVYVYIYNGNSSAVTINRTGDWEFWDGGVGGSLVESGSVSWSSSISIGAYSTWTGTIRFTSPRGSGIYDTYDDKEDMTIKLTMRTTSGTVISDTLTCRVMVGFGMDIIRVASDTFVGQQYTDLYDAVDVCQDIYEARDITFRGVGRYHIDDSDAGGYGIINSESECRDLFDDWSAASGGTYLDVFVCHDFSGTSFDGLAGDIPGPTSHSGDRSGVGVDKTGYVDSGGTTRLNVDYLGMLIGHEVGHYLGLSHLSVAGNLMHPSSGTYDTDLTYDQYRDVLDFGWMYVV